MSGLASVFDLVPGWILQALNFGTAYPKGDEDDLFALGDAWKQAAEELRLLEPDLRAATDATAKFYSGDGAVEVKKEFDKLFSGPNSVDELAKALEELGTYTRNGGTQLEYTKVMEGSFALITAYAVYALIAAWPWGSAGVPLALAAGRTAVGAAATRGLQQLALEAGRAGLRNLLKPYLKQITIAGLKAGGMGMGLDGGIQAYQLGMGHRDSFDIGQNLRTGFEWGAGGVVGAPVGMGMHKLLGRTGMSPAMRGVLSGVTGGAAGGLGMYGGGLAWQVGDQLAHGYFDANKIDTTFDPKLVVVGAALGGAHGVRSAAGLGHAPTMEAPRMSPAGASAAKAPIVTEASVREGKQLYHDLAKQTHPDRFEPGAEQNRAHDVFQRANDVKIDSKGRYSDQHVARLEQLRTEWNNSGAAPRDGATARPTEAAMRAETQGRADSGARAEGSTTRAPESVVRASDSGARTAVSERAGTAAPEARTGERPAAGEAAGKSKTRAGLAEQNSATSNLTATSKDRVAEPAGEQRRAEPRTEQAGATAEAPGASEPGRPKEPAVAERPRAETELVRSEPTTRPAPPVVEPGTRAGVTLEPHGGTAASVGEFHGEARPPNQPDLTTREVVHAVEDSLALITPADMAWNRDTKRFLLPDGRDISVTTEPTTGGAVAEFRGRPDGTGYDVHVSPRARDQDVVRGVAHEIAEIRLAQEPEIIIDPVRESPDRLTDHLGGRFAEVRVLLNKIDAATIDPARADQLPGLRRDLADLAGHLDLHPGSTAEQLLGGHDPALAQRYSLERSGLTEHRPIFSESLTAAEYDRGSAAHLATLNELAAGEHVRDLVANERHGLDARMREELARRIFDPIFENPNFREARRHVPTAHLMAAMDPLNVAINDPNPAAAQRGRDLHEAIDRFHTAMPEPFRTAIGPDAFQRMHDAAQTLAASPNRFAAVLEHGTGRLETGGVAGSMSDLLHSVDRANRTAAANGINIEYTVMIHEPVHGLSAVEIIPRPRPLHRLPLEQYVFGANNERVELVHRPPTGVPNGHTVDVGVGRSAFGVEMTPPADRTGGGLVVKTELAESFAIPSQRRRSLGILDPGPLTDPGTVLVFGDMLGGGHVLGDGTAGGVGRIFVNNVSAKLPPEAYLSIAANLEHTLAPGGRIELQWDMKSEAADPSKGTPGDRGHIDGDQLWTALLEHYDNRPPFRIEEYTEFPGAGNNDYDYTIDAGASNVLNKDKMDSFSAPRPDHRMVIVYDPTLRGLLAPPRR